MRRRFLRSGLFAALLALMAQLGSAGSLPRLDAVAQLAQAEALCHDPGVPAPHQAPAHPLDCLMCPLCVATHATHVGLVPEAQILPAPSVAPIRRAELPPPATAPPVARHPPQQPRAPPVIA